MPEEALLFEIPDIFNTLTQTHTVLFGVEAVLAVDLVGDCTAGHIGELDQYILFGIHEFQALHHAMLPLTQVAGKGFFKLAPGAAVDFDTRPLNGVMAEKLLQDKIIKVLRAFAQMGTGNELFIDNQCIYRKAAFCLVEGLKEMRAHCVAALGEVILWDMLGGFHGRFDNIGGMFGGGTAPTLFYFGKHNHPHYKVTGGAIFKACIPAFVYQHKHAESMTGLRERVNKLNLPV